MHTCTHTRRLTHIELLPIAQAAEGLSYLTLFEMQHDRVYIGLAVLYNLALLVVMVMATSVSTRALRHTDHSLRKIVSVCEPCEHRLR